MERQSYFHKIEMLQRETSLNQGNFFKKTYVLLENEECKVECFKLKMSL